MIDFLKAVKCIIVMFKGSLIATDFVFDLKFLELFLFILLNKNPNFLADGVSEPFIKMS